MGMMARQGYMSGREMMDMMREPGMMEEWMAEMLGEPELTGVDCPSSDGSSRRRRERRKDRCPPFELADKLIPGGRRFGRIVVVSLLASSGLYRMGSQPAVRETSRDPAVDAPAGRSTVTREVSRALATGWRRGG